MRKDWKYILYISIAFGLFVLLKLLSPKQHNWTITFGADDKNPYGGYALHELLKTFVPESGLRHSYKTLYELKDTIEDKGTIFILSTRFTCEEEDGKVLLNHVNAGGTAFISAEYFWGYIADTLQLDSYDYLFRSGNIFTKTDSTALKLASINLDTLSEFYFRSDNVHNYFRGFDTTRTTVIARNDRDQPVTIRVKWGKGNFILNTTPMVFTNIQLLSGRNHEFVSSQFSYMPDEPVEWTEYYHRGRMEIRTPLRFILLNEPLSWAYYITVICIVAFMIFEMKRKQRIIPIVKSLQNTTLEFVSTIGNLYYQGKEHKSIAEKRIHYLMEQIRAKHWISTNSLDESFIQALARKTAKPEEEVRDLVHQILKIQSASEISETELIEFNGKLEKFNS